VSDAVALQRGLLPRVPLVRGSLLVSGDVLSSGRASGDHFDVFDGHDGRTTVLLIDVAGHGLAAAFVANAAREAMRSTLQDGGTPEEAAGALERCLAAHRDVRRASASLILLRFSADGGLVEIVNAGMPPVLLLDEGHVVAAVVSRSMPAGFASAADHPAEIVRLAEGGILIAASDGATGGSLEVDGVRALADRLLADEPHPASASPEVLRDAVRAHLGVVTPPDDASVVVVSRRGAR
jgi:serine phosphatase RsbU (regulator of sigma subunit)